MPPPPAMFLNEKVTVAVVFCIEFSAVKVYKARSEHANRIRHLKELRRPVKPKRTQLGNSARMLRFTKAVAVLDKD